MATVPKFLAICAIMVCCEAQQAPEERFKPPRPEPKLAERFKWNRLDFKFENDVDRQNALKSNSFIPNNTIPFGVGIWEDKVFITIPRRFVGIPSTLNYVNLNSSENSPLLIPYPNWVSNRPTLGNIISVYRINVDSCGRLWALDTGSIIDFQGNGERIQAPRVLVIDLKTDIVLKSHQINSSVCNAIHTNIFPDVRDSCDDAYAYAVDPSSNGLLVYSLRQDRSWRKAHSYFNPDPFQTDYLVNGVSFSWNDGIFGFGLTERNEKGDRLAYFHPTSSLNEFKINTNLLGDPNTNSRLPTNQISVVATRNATFQAGSQVYDEKSGILFYSLVNKNAMGCWNTKKRGNFASNSDIVVSNDRTMVYFTDIKVDKNNYFWALTNRLPEVIYGVGLLPDQTNFRVFTGSVRQAIKNTKCDAGRFSASKNE